MSFRQSSIIAVIILAVIFGVGLYAPEMQNIPKSSAVPSTTPRATTRRTPVAQSGKLILIPDVPFAPQAPFGDWNDPRQQAGCEEAAALMAMRWVYERGLTLLEAEREIVAMSDYELDVYDEFHDLSAQDFVDRIFKGYFNYDNVRAQYDIGGEDIVQELLNGNLVLVPANGRKLNNPYYTLPGPLRHMLVIRGHDPVTKEFITNDPGTKHGELFRYPENVVMDAIYEYPTGDHEPVSEIRKVMVVVEPKT